MLTLTRREGQRVFIGSIIVEVVAVDRGEITLRVLGADESSIALVDEPSTVHASRPRQRRAPPAPRRRETAPLIVEVRRSRKQSGGT